MSAPISPPLMTLKDLIEDANNKVSQVIQARNRQTGQILAFKVIKSSRSKTVFPPTVMHEVYLLQRLIHQNVVTLCNVTYGDSLSPMLVLEHMDHCLKTFMGDTGSLEFLTIKSFMYQLLEGISFCHQSGVVHRNITSRSILINRQGRLKLSDFSNAVDLENPSASDSIQVGYVCYRAPEVIFGYGTCDAPIDVWAAGCVMSEMYTRCQLFSSNSDFEHLKIIFKIVGTPTLESWPEALGYAAAMGFSDLFRVMRPAKNLQAILPGIDDTGADLFLRLLVCDPRKRVWAREVTSHVWFQHLDCHLKKRMEIYFDKHRAEIIKGTAKAESEEASLMEYEEHKYDTSV